MSDGSRLIKLELTPRDATLSRVMDKLKLKTDDVDSEFGLVTLDPEHHLYAIVVAGAVAQRLQGIEGVVGSFSNPVIEPFGPARPSTRRR